jgi:hypothetical protein
MRIHLEKFHDSPNYALLLERAKASRAHTLAGSPAEADLIIMIGNVGEEPSTLLDNATYRAYPEKCACYTELDHFIPLLPGVYTSARKSLDTRVGRVFTYDYVGGYGRFMNRFVEYRPDAEKKFLFTFQGGSTCILRKRMFNLKFNRPDVLIENTSSYGHWHEVPPTGHFERQRLYSETLSASNFVLCPRGAGSSSVRFFEVLRAGVAPVLIADNYVLPPGVDWDRFLVRVKERDIARLPQILEPLLPTAAERGRLAREAWLANFAPEVQFDAIAGLCARSLRHGPPPEAEFRARQARILAAERRRRARYDFARNTALALMRLLRIRNPYQMNER